ncbi:MAG: bifunctional 4-hydroxy-2-oxoglutarate aldolase/2-dehydro-3-deoxy-phosphogluconate aldolase [Pseudorhodoplanes sp.]
MVLRKVSPVFSTLAGHAMPPDPMPLTAKSPVIPVLTIVRLADAVPLARALVAGGLPVIEVALRSPVALAAIRAIKTEVPGAIVGAGTLLTIEDIQASRDAGAAYLVTPGTPSALVDPLLRASVPVIPGCATVSEAMALAARGFKVLKFFPAEASGGVAWLKSVAGPLPHVRFCPTGGINAANAGRYLTLPNVAAVGGSWVAPDEALTGGDFPRVTALARAASQLRS